MSFSFSRFCSVCVPFHSFFSRFVQYVPHSFAMSRVFQEVDCSFASIDSTPPSALTSGVGVGLLKSWKESQGNQCQGCGIAFPQDVLETSHFRKKQRWSLSKVMRSGHMFGSPYAWRRQVHRTCLATVLLCRGCHLLHEKKQLAPKMGGRGRLVAYVCNSDGRRGWIVDGITTICLSEQMVLFAWSWDVPPAN